MSLYDEVAFVREKTDCEDGAFKFLRVLSHSGHGTVRAILLEDALRAVAEAAIDRVEAMGCTWEGGGDVLAIDIPPGVDTNAVLRALAPAREAGALFLDIGFVPSDA